MEPGKSLVARESSDLFPSAQQWQTMSQIADVLIKSNLLPQHVKTAQAALAIMLKGRELGVPSMHALSNIVVVQGKPTCSAELMLALDYRDHGDDAVIITETTAERCTISYKRRGWKERQTYSFTMDDAERAGIAETQTWKKYPQAMLRARAISAVSRMAFPDSIAGMYVYEEMGLSVEVDGGEQVVVSDDRAEELVSQSAEAGGVRPSPPSAGSAAVPDADAQGPEKPQEKPPAQNEDSFTRRASAALGPSGARTDGKAEQQPPPQETDPHAVLRSEVLHLLTDDPEALDAFQGGGRRLEDMDAARLRGWKKRLMERAGKRTDDLPRSTLLSRQIAAARSDGDLGAARRAVQDARNAREITEAEWLSLMSETETRKSALAGPLTAGAAS